MEVDEVEEGKERVWKCEGEMTMMMVVVVVVAERWRRRKRRMRREAKAFGQSQDRLQMLSLSPPLHPSLFSLSSLLSLSLSNLSLLFLSPPPLPPPEEE